MKTETFKHYMETEWLGELPYQITYEQSPFEPEERNYPGCAESFEVITIAVNIGGTFHNVDIEEMGDKQIRQVEQLCSDHFHGELD